jgi:hypothetical protein
MREFGLEVAKMWVISPDGKTSVNLLNLIEITQSDNKIYFSNGYKQVTFEFGTEAEAIEYKKHLDEILKMANVKEVGEK